MPANPFKKLVEDDFVSKRVAEVFLLASSGDLDATVVFLLRVAIFDGKVLQYVLPRLRDPGTYITGRNNQYVLYRSLTRYSSEYCTSTGGTRYQVLYPFTFVFFKGLKYSPLNYLFPIGLIHKQYHFWADCYW